jgi:antitoxin YefM
MATESLRNVKDRFSEVIDRVESQHERVVVTRNGRPAAVILSTDDLESLEETLDILGNTDTVKALLEAEEAVAAGDVVRGIDAVRALRAPKAR